MKPELQVSKKKSLCEGIISTFLMTVIGMDVQTSFRHFHLENITKEHCSPSVICSRESLFSDNSSFLGKQCETSVGGSED